MSARFLKVGALEYQISQASSDLKEGLWILGSLEFLLWDSPSNICRFIFFEAMEI